MRPISDAATVQGVGGIFHCFTLPCWEKSVPVQADFVPSEVHLTE